MGNQKERQSTFIRMAKIIKSQCKPEGVGNKLEKLRSERKTCEINLNVVMKSKMSHYLHKFKN